MVVKSMCQQGSPAQCTICLLVILLGKHEANILTSALQLIHTKKHLLFLCLITLQQMSLIVGATCGEPNSSSLAPVEQKLSSGWDMAFGGGIGARLLLPLPAELGSPALWGAGGPSHDLNIAHLWMFGVTGRFFSEKAVGWILPF